MTTAEVADHDHRIEWRDLDDLLKVRLKDNPKKHDIDVILASIDKFGFIDPVLVGTVGGDKGAGLLGAGHGRLKGLERRRAEKKKAPRGIRVVDGKWTVPTIAGIHFQSKAAYRAYVVVANRAVEVGGWDAGLVDYLKGLGKDLAFTGYGDADLKLLAAARDPWTSDIGALQGGSHLDAIPGKVVITCKPEQADPIRKLVEQTLKRRGFKGVEVS